MFFVVIVKPGKTLVCQTSYRKFESYLPRMFFTSITPEFYNLLLVFIFGIYLIFSLSYSTTFSSIQLYSFPQLNNTSINNTMFVIFTLLILLSFTWADRQFGMINGSFIWNFYCFFFSFLLLLCTISFLYISKEFVANKKIINYEYDLIIVFSLLGLSIVNMCNDFLTLYVAIELHSLCFYVLATFNKNSEYCAEAGMKYFILGAFSSGLLLSSFAFFYVSSGSISLEAFERVNFMSCDPVMCLASILLMISLLFKLGAFPFHMWLCDVYDGSSINVMALFSTVPKVIILGFLIRFFFTVFSYTPDITSYLLAFSGLGSIGFASIAALYQKRVKRLLAYSTVSHTGFLVLGLYCFTVDSIKACIVYIAIYVLMNLVLFGILFISGMNNAQQKYIINWTSFFDRNICVALVFSITLFSVAGIPPLAGFYSKLCILTCLLSESNVWIPCFVAFFSSVACFYYIRLIKVLCFTNDYKKSIWFGSGTKHIEFFISVAFTLITLFLVRPSLLLNCSMISAMSLF